MFEKGRVVEVPGPGRAVIEIDRKSACASCHSRSACHPENRGRVSRVSAVSTVDVKPGDTVEFDIAESAFLTAVLWAYVVPAALLIVGAFAVWYGVTGTSLESSRDMLAAGGALAGAGVGVIIMRIVNNRIRKPGTKAEAKFTVRVVGVVDPEESAEHGPLSDDCGQPGNDGRAP